MQEVTELQKKRAENIIWNCARSYSFTPDFKAYDREGFADLYWNCIIGAVRRYYDYSVFEKILRAFSQYEESDTYEGLFWLGLENCVYQKELPERPVLERLRRDYALSFTQTYSSHSNYYLLDALSFAHWQRALGLEPQLSRYDIKLLDELEFTPDMTTAQIAERTQELFKRWFQITTQEKKQRSRKLFTLSRWKKKGEDSGKCYRPFGLGFADHSDTLYGGQIAQQDELQVLATRLTPEELREFMETKFGRPVFPQHQVQELERTLCCGNHNHCHLLFTDGVRIADAEIRNGFEAISRQREAAQIELNRKFYANHLPENRTAIAKLSSKISNSVLLHMQAVSVKSDSGRLNKELVWRAPALNDGRVFTHLENDVFGNLSVDILLDASTSQKNRQEIISSQAFIIAESLTRCSIPCRVMSFCSMTGYTIVRIFRDYSSPGDNKKVFDYVSNGCNRDGLAIRAAHHLLANSIYEHRLLIILSDVKPNDVVRITKTSGSELVPYDSDAGLTDTALEVRRARTDGIAVVCIFTGEDEDVNSAKMVYGQDFVRIRSLDRLADSVGLLIQNCIKNL